MQEPLLTIDKLLIDIFDDILCIEEHILKKGNFSDVTVKEMHTVEAIGLHGQKSAGAVAKLLGITLGTLTCAVNSLIKKGYVIRSRDSEDRRVVNLSLTNRGKLLYRIHRQFHNKLVREAVSGFSEMESEILALSLTKLHHYITENFIAISGNE